MVIGREKRDNIRFQIVTDDLRYIRSAILSGLEETNDGFKMSFWIKLGKLIITNPLLKRTIPCSTLQL